MAGNVFTVITRVLLQPVGNVYVITEVPLAIPVAMPLAGSMVALVVFPLVQVPLPAAVSAAVAPTQVARVPLIAAAAEFTVTTAVT